MSRIVNEIASAMEDNRVLAGKSGGTDGIGYMKQPEIPSRKLLTRIHRVTYLVSRNNPGSFGEGARSRFERIGSCFFQGVSR